MFRKIINHIIEYRFSLCLGMLLAKLTLNVTPSDELSQQTKVIKETTEAIASETHFKEAVTFVLSKEGIYSNHIHDKGGVTKYGITTASNPEIEIENLTEAQAIEIYKNQYWNPTMIPMIHDPNLRIKFFDASVNIGYVQATKLLQRALNCTGVESIVDGVFGKKTLANVNNCKNPFGLQYAFIAFLVNFYEDIVQRDPTQNVFLLGWMNRAHDIVGD